MALITGLMTRGTKWRGVFQITYFCAIYLIFGVHEYAKCIHTEKLAKSQRTIRVLIDGHLTHSRMMTWQMWFSSVIVPAHVSILAT